MAGRAASDPGARAGLASHRLIGMAQIRRYKRADGTYRYGVRWRDRAGRDHWRAAGPIRRDAVRLKQEIERQLALGPLYEAPPETFGEFLTGWLDRHAQRVRPNTIRRYEEVASHLAPLSGVLVNRLAAAQVDDLVVTVSRSASRQAEIALQLVKMLIRDARRRGHRIDEAILEVSPPRRELREMRFLTWGEVEHLASCTFEPFNRMIVVAALTGLRQGELFALKVGSVDLPSRCLRVDAGVVDGQLAPLKTRGSRRSVGLCARAAEMLQEQMRSERRNRYGLVWPAPEGGVLHKDNFGARVYRPAIKRAGIGPIRFHDLRHTYAALMVSAGAHPKLLQAQMGHSSIKVTLDLYGHLYPDIVGPVTQALDALISPDSAQSELSGGEEERKKRRAV